MVDEYDVDAAALARPDEVTNNWDDKYQAREENRST
jgi:hypothetical protein